MTRNNQELAHALLSALDSDDKWAESVTIAHLRIPRIELIQYTYAPEEMYHIVAKLIIDKAMTALCVTTWPGHEGPHQSYGGNE